MKVRCSEAGKCKDMACQHHGEHEKGLMFDKYNMCDWEGCAVVMKKVRCVRVKEAKE